MMHLTCTNMPVHKIDHALHTIKSNGIQNVLALHGDLPHGQDKFVQVQGGFACALDLVGYYFPLLQISVCVCLFLNNNLAWLGLAWLPSQVKHIRSHCGDYFGITLASINSSSFLSFLCC
ncbi:hypothetical protein Tsubulata_039143 [Turnera subulata]|uniref:Methylenetetrahydrofolate reductase n=1 Tax=Turnera subulata TaxID=218843 RepID=A0A9Q0GIQ8_9ROSI|nr:hypothetical protein Tsubulata_017711 [Turnera subulata]KAJ4850617.1 hypothetical protein Tsubulata_039143 [Turnera subulata]